MSDLPATTSLADTAAGWYAGHDWVRAVVQLVPYAGGSLDTLLAARGNSLARERVTELIYEVSRSLEALGHRTVDKPFLQSEEFYEILEAAATVAARSASAEKRASAAAILTGSIERGSVSDLTRQIARDLQSLDDVHLRVLAVLPQEAEMGVDPRVVPTGVLGMDIEVYRKAMSDLERHGFIRFDNAGIGAYGGGTGEWKTTGYVGMFRREILSIPATQPSGSGSN